MKALIAAAALVALASCDSAPAAKTPPSCLQALDAAEVVIGKAGDALDVIGSAIDAAVAGYVQGVMDANAKLHAMGDAVGGAADRYRNLAAECRSAG